MKRFACLIVIAFSTCVATPGCGGGGAPAVQNSAEDQDYYAEIMAKDQAMDKAHAGE